MWRLRRYGCADDCGLGRGDVGSHIGWGEHLDDDRRADFVSGGLVFVDRSEHDVCFVIEADCGDHSSSDDGAHDARADHCPCADCSADDRRTAPVTTAATTTPAATSTVANGTSPVGFGTIGIAIRAAGGASKTFCLWLADTDARRQRGLMQVTGLGGKSGMIFTYGSDTDEQFWMYQTVMPLSIAFFDSTGAFVSSADMAPCPGAPSTCPSYPAAGKYRDAIEVPQGGLAALGIGPGSALTDRGSCPA